MPDRDSGQGHCYGKYRRRAPDHGWRRGLRHPYAPADFLDIDLFMKPTGYAGFTIIFAQGRMVLAYSASALAAKKLPPIAEPSGRNAVRNWYQILTMPGVAIGGGNPFLDPGVYRGPMIFQIAEHVYQVQNLYNNLLEHVVVPGPRGIALGKGFDFQFTYEHTAKATAATNPDYEYVILPDEISLADPAKDAYYRQHGVVVLPGLGTTRSARTIAVPASHVAWGITIMNSALNRDGAIKFLQLLLSPASTALLNEYGPTPIFPALVNRADLSKLPEPLRAAVKSAAKKIGVGRYGTPRSPFAPLCRARACPALSGLRARLNARREQQHSKQQDHRPGASRNFRMVSRRSADVVHCVPWTVSRSRSMRLPING